MVYTVRQGDTIYLIAQKFGVSMAAIISANNLTNPDQLVVGQELIIPVTFPAQGPTLYPGSTGPAVRVLQQSLKTLGYYSDVVDGFFGPVTEAAVRKFQADHGLVVDGVVGPVTWSAIAEALSGIPGPTTTPLPTTPVPVPTVGPTLFLGSTGPAVRVLQQSLKTLGYYTGNVDGIFGPVTDAAVRKFQADWGLVVDGVVGPLTWRAIIQALSGVPAPTPTITPPPTTPIPIPTVGPTLFLGSTGPAVRVLQQSLKTLGYYTGNVDGIFGPMTDAAVRKFQADWGLVVDGVVGPLTWRAIILALSGVPKPTVPPTTIPPTTIPPTTIPPTTIPPTTIPPTTIPPTTIPPTTIPPTTIPPTTIPPTTTPPTGIPGEPANLPAPQNNPGQYYNMTVILRPMGRAPSLAIGYASINTTNGDTRVEAIGLPAPSTFGETALTYYAYFEVPGTPTVVGRLSQGVNTGEYSVRATVAVPITQSRVTIRVSGVTGGDPGEYIMVGRLV